MYTSLIAGILNSRNLALKINNFRHERFTEINNYELPRGVFDLAVYKDF